ncbi:MAG: sigma-70 family RNA polymerase sigma factor [Chitinophagaceae bacterium]|nr:sigma-70 family RNA polymerase sigma factor [Chitinophagaceae bacterium]
MRSTADGDQRAFRELYDSYWQRIYSTALTILQSHDRSMDIVQETFIRVWNYRTKLNNVENFEAYLYTIAKNQIRTVLKAHKKLLPPDSLSIKELTDKSPSPETSSALRQFEQLVIEASRQLPPQQEKVFRLSRFEHLAYEEIAERLQIAPDTVRNHLIKALNFIRTYFSERHKDLLFILLAVDFNFILDFFWKH